MKRAKSFSLRAPISSRFDGIDPAAIDDVVMGCVTQAGEQGLSLGRDAVLASRLPQSVPAVTINGERDDSRSSLTYRGRAENRPQSSQSVNQALRTSFQK